MKRSGGQRGRGAALGWALSGAIVHLLVLAIVAALSMAGAASAQDVDPPGRAGRLAEVRGQVWLQGVDGGEWIAPTRNRPIAAGDRLSTEPAARAEIQIGSTVLRLDASTEIDVAALDDDRLSIGLVQGSLALQVRDPSAAGQVEVATNDGRFVVLGAGSLRVDHAGGRSDLTVYAGTARYEGPNSALVVEPGQRAQFFIDGSGVAQYTLAGPVDDAFAAWARSRTGPATSLALAERYVSPEMTGVAELDAYGRWERDPEEGSVWVPTTVAADWAPYTAGHWTWVRPWGWSWVDDAPWGFAPFHYGRWTYARNRWCWVPGQRVARPVYAPALVAWVGAPVSRGTFAGGPPVGWVPLAPREVYVPAYRVSDRYARSVNLGNVPNVGLVERVFERPQAPRDFANRGAPRGVTFVPPDALAGRRPVGPIAAEMRRQPWMREIAGQRGGWAPMLEPPVAPPRFDGRIGRDARPPGTIAGRGGEPWPRGVVTTTRPGAPGFAPPGEVRSGGAAPIGRPGQPPYDGRIGQPPYDGRVGQAPSDGRVGQPPYDGRVGQPGFDGRTGQGDDGRFGPGNGGRPGQPFGEGRGPRGFDDGRGDRPDDRRDRWRDTPGPGRPDTGLPTPVIRGGPPPGAVTGQPIDRERGWPAGATAPSSGRSLPPVGVTAPSIERSLPPIGVNAPSPERSRLPVGVTAPSPERSRLPVGAPPNGPNVPNGFGGAPMPAAPSMQGQPVRRGEEMREGSRGGDRSLGERRGPEGMPTQRPAEPPRAPPPAAAPAPAMQPAPGMQVRPEMRGGREDGPRRGEMQR